MSLFAYEQHTGTEIFLRREQLLTLKRAPFGVGPRDLLVAFAANAEMSCFLALGWPFPINVLDLYVETIAAINGRTDIWPQKGRPGLLAALELHGLPAPSADTKTDMRRLILDHTDYTAEQWRDDRRLQPQPTVWTGPFRCSTLWRAALICRAHCIAVAT